MTEPAGTADLTSDAAPKNFLVIYCEACETFNRIPRSRLAGAPKCGMCDKPLSSDEIGSPAIEDSKQADSETEADRGTRDAELELLLPIARNRVISAEAA